MSLTAGRSQKQDFQSLQEWHFSQNQQYRPSSGNEKHSLWEANSHILSELGTQRDFYDEKKIAIGIFITKKERLREKVFFWYQEESNV